MSTAGWIFLVGMRVIDLGGLIVWLVWFFRHQDDADDWSDWDDDEGGGSDRPQPNRPRGPGGRELDLPLPDAGPWPVRVRDHTAARPALVPQRRGVPERGPHPVREPA